MPSYYPKSQITPDLYTNGGEFSLSSNGKNYIGFYYEISTGERYTGRNPNFGGNILLIETATTDPPLPENLSLNTPIVELTNDQEKYPDPYTDFDTFSYEGLNNNFSVRALPTPFLSEPTKGDRAVGEYRRYFAKKTNELIYLEISKETYNKLESNDPTIASDLYEYLFLPWSLNNDETNKKIAANVERNNKWYGFSSYISRYLIKETQEDLFTRGGEYLTDKGENYIGFYHIHPSKGPMVGAKHINSPHGYLFAVNQISGSQSTSEIGGNIGVSSTGGSMGYSGGTSTPSAPTGGGGGGY